MARSHQFILALLLLGAAGWLIFAIRSYQPPIVDTGSTAPSAAESQASAPSDPAPAITATDPPALTEFSEMVDRPLFSPDRRPASPAGVEQRVATEPVGDIVAGRVETSQFLVMGIVITEGEKVALLRAAKPPGEVVKVREGQKISDWTIDSITPEAVLISKQGVSDTIKLSDNILSEAEKKRLIQISRQSQARRARQRPAAQPADTAAPPPTRRVRPPGQRRPQPRARTIPPVRTQVR